MESPFIVSLDSIPMRFTPDGKVSVIDAIRAVIDSDCPAAIWENMKVLHPEILIYCEDYSFQGEDLVTVIDSVGWEKVWLLLPDYLAGPHMM